MEILEYKRFLSTLSLQDLKDYLYELDIKTLTDEERKELEYYLTDMRVKKVLQYLAVFGFLTIVLKGIAKFAELASALGITKPEIPAPGERPYDLVWVTADGACDECLAEEGKIYGKTTDKIPTLHPHCMCKFVKVYREEVPAMKAIGLRWAPGGAVRAMKSGEKMALEVLAAPFGSPSHKDRLNQYLTANTDYMIEVGDRRPTMYLHGYSPRRRAMDKPSVLGTAEVSRVDSMGVWMYTELDDSPLSRRTWEAAKRGEARASTGSIAHLVRPLGKHKGEVTCWPIAELSVWDDRDDVLPVSDDAVVIPLRALFDDLGLEYDERFEAGEAEDLIGRRSEMIIMDDLEDEMDTKELQGAVDKSVAGALLAIKEQEKAAKETEDALRAKILEEQKGDPKYRSVFNVNTITNRDLTITDEEAKRGVTKASKEENNAFIWHLMHPSQAPAAMRVLEESEAAEGGPMVPDDMLNKITTLKGEKSLVDLIGIARRKTNRLLFNFPTETAAMGALASTAEEGAYLVDEPAFTEVGATLVKYTAMVTLTEEMLDDQDLFEPYFVGAVAKSWRLAENLELFTKLKATDTVGKASATFTDVEIMAWFFAMTGEWAEGASMVCLRATIGIMRALLIGTPRAYGAFPEFGGGEYPSFMGLPLYTNTNWEVVASGAGALQMSLVSPDAVGWVENKNLQIKVDPYGDAANGRVRYFPRARFDCEILQVLGHVSYLDA